MDEVEATSTMDPLAAQETPGDELSSPELSTSARPDESLALAAAQYRSSAKPLTQRIRVLGVPLPVAGFSWTISILFHAALICIGVVLYRHFIHPPKLALALGDGGTKAVGIMWREQTPGGTGLPQVPEIDATQAPADSMAAVMNKIVNTEEPEPRMSASASSYVGPKLLWGAPPPVGAGHGNSDVAGSPAAHRGSAPAASPKTPPAQKGEGTGRGKSVGAGSGQVNGGQAGVPGGTPDPTLPAPVYPEESRRRGEEGLVRLSIIILGDGSVGNIDVVSQPPYPRLTRSAIDAVKQAHFDRAYSGQTLIVPYHFVLH